MIVDANLLLYAKISAFPEHVCARQWLDGVLSSHSRCGIPWESITAFIRVATNGRVLERPLEVRLAWKQIREWLSRPNVWIPTPTDEHQEILDDLIPLCAGNPGLIHDAHLAALAKSHGLAIASADADFARFPDIRWKNPLIS